MASQFIYACKIIFYLFLKQNEICCHLVSLLFYCISVWLCKPPIGRSQTMERFSLQTILLWTFLLCFESHFIASTFTK